jgi:hypothetical protein
MSTDKTETTTISNHEQQATMELKIQLQIIYSSAPKEREIEM